MRSHTTALIVFALALSCVQAQAQQTAPNPPPVFKKYGEVGGWVINAESINGQHMACSAMPPGDAGAKGAFEPTVEGLTVLVVTATKGEQGDESKGAYDIDGRSTRIPFYRRENARNMGFLRAEHAKQLAAGKAKIMTVTIGKEKTILPLAGVDAALKKVMECDEKEGG